MKYLIPAALTALSLASPALAQDHSAEAVTSAVLNGFLARDVAAIAPHSNETNADFFAAILAGTEDPNELWGGTRGEAATTWDGMILPARYQPDRAIVPFAIEGPNGPVPLGSGQPGRYMVLTLVLDGPNDTTWGVEDINYIDRADYAARAATPQ